MKLPTVSSQAEDSPVIAYSDLEVIIKFQRGKVHRLGPEDLQGIRLTTAPMVYSLKPADADALRDEDKQLPLWYAEDGKGVQSNFKHMCRVQNFAVRWITGGFRGTPIGVMELISGIPPLRLRCNLLIVGYAARIMTLPDDHLLRKVWQMDVTATRLRHFSPKHRPKNQPSDNPLTRLKAMGTISEQFFEFDPANKRGDRVVDRFADRISYLNLDAPKKGSDCYSRPRSLCFHSMSLTQVLS